MDSYFLNPGGKRVHRRSRCRRSLKSGVAILRRFPRRRAPFGTDGLASPKSDFRLRGLSFGNSPTPSPFVFELEFSDHEAQREKGKMIQICDESQGLPKRKRSGENRDQSQNGENELPFLTELAKLKSDQHGDEERPPDFTIEDQSLEQSGLKKLQRLDHEPVIHDIIECDRSQDQRKQETPFMSSFRPSHDSDKSRNTEIEFERSSIEKVAA